MLIYLSDLVAEYYIAPIQTRENRSVLRVRTNLVQDGTRLMNRVHSLLDKYDVKCDYDHIFGVKGTGWLRSLKLMITIRFYYTNMSFR